MMGCAQSKKNVQIKSMLPKNHEISSVSGEIILEKDEVLIFYVLKETVMDFCQLVFVSGQSILHLLHNRLLFPILTMTVDMIVNKFF